MINLLSIKVAEVEPNENFAASATYTGAIELGVLKGSPFAKVTFDPKSVQTQSGNKTLGKTGKVEIGVLVTPTAALAASLRALEGKNVAALCTPKGTVDSTNPMIVIKNWMLQIKGEMNIGEPSFITLFNDSIPVFDEADLIQAVTALTGS